MVCVANGSDNYVEPAQRKGEARYLLQVRPDGSAFYGDWADLGSDGTGYLLIDRTRSPVQVVWFWNR